MSTRIVTSGMIREWVLPSPDGDKEARGRLLVIGGSRRNPGAVMLAAEAAMRSGAGKLQVATVDAVAAPLGIAIPEAMVVGLADVDGEIDPATADQLVELANECRAVLIGPGMGDAPAASQLLAGVVPQLDTHVVIDAVAMAYITDHRNGLAHLQGRAVLSPNLTELAITLGRSNEEVADDPPRHVERLAEETGAVVVSGGSHSWIAEPAGRVWRDESGVPGLATSGSGDVKAGVIAGLMVRGADPAQAAVWATFAHGRAGERLAARVGPVGFLARDLLTEIPQVLAEMGPS